MDNSETTRSDRARYHEEVRDIYYALCPPQGKKRDPEHHPFESMKDVFMFAACLGYRTKRRMELGEGRKEGMRMEVFSESDRDTMKAIAIAETGDVVVLEKKAEEKMSSTVLSIVEEYAHGGIMEMKRLVSDKQGASLWNLVDLISTR